MNFVELVTLVILIIVSTIIVIALDDVRRSLLRFHNDLMREHLWHLGRYDKIDDILTDVQKKMECEDCDDETDAGAASATVSESGSVGDVPSHVMADAEWYRRRKMVAVPDMSDAGSAEGGAYAPDVEARHKPNEMPHEHEWTWLGPLEDHYLCSCGAIRGIDFIEEARKDGVAI